MDKNKPWWNTKTVPNLFKVLRGFIMTKEELDDKLEDDYDYFCEYFSSEFDEAISALNTLKILHIKYGHELLAEDLI